MSNQSKSRRFAKACLYMASLKMALAVIPLGESAWADEPGVSWWGILVIIAGLTLIGLTLIPLYQRAVIADLRRRRIRRYLGASCCVDGLARIIIGLWPTALYPLLEGIGLAIGICFVIAVMLDYSDDGDKPRRKRRRFRAKWPSWLPKRWVHTPPLPSPRGL